MKHTSRLFGEFTYEENEIIEFPEGLLGFQDSHCFVLRSDRSNPPIHWLLSVEPNGPELALIDPAKVSRNYALGAVSLRKGILNALQCKDPKQLLRFAVVTVPESVKQISMNLRTPIFINPKSRRGLQYPEPGIDKKPVRCLIYRDLIASREEDKPGTVVVLRRENETINIGDEITIHVMEFADGGVRLGINAPKHVRISRDDMKLTPGNEMKRASETMSLERLHGLMSMHNVVTNPDIEAVSAISISEPNTIAG